MHLNRIPLLLLPLIFPCLLQAQQPDPPPTEKDSVSAALNESGVVFQDSLQQKKKNIDPLAPSRAAFYSAILPGLGQIYNKRYWKAPIVWGAIGGGIYVYSWNNDNYKRFRTAFKRRQAGFTDDEFNGEGQLPFLDNDRLQREQERYQRDRDLWLVISIALYGLNIIDANVDAHLKQFNIDNDLGVELDLEPYLDLSPFTNEPNYGVALSLKF